MVGLKKKTVTCAKISPKSGEPQRYSWGTQKKKKKKKKEEEEEEEVEERMMGEWEGEMKKRNKSQSIVTLVALTLPPCHESTRHIVSHFIKSIHT